MIKADVRIHNVVYECIGCGEIKVVSEENKPIAILMLQGIKPVEKKENDYDMVYQTVFVEPACLTN